MGTITLNGVSSDSIGIKVSTYPDYEYPDKNVEVINIPGRNGEVLYDLGTYKNVDISYEVSIYDVDSTTGLGYGGMAKLIAWLHPKSGYFKISDSYMPGYYHLGYCKNSGQVASILGQAGKATIKFNCRPERYLTDGDTYSDEFGTNASEYFTHPLNTASLIYPYEAKPLIKVNNSGDGGTVEFINNALGKHSVVTLPGSSVFDCETCDALRNNGYSGNGATAISGDFPALWPGETQIKANNVRIQVMPKWWIL